MFPSRPIIHWEGSVISNTEQQVLITTRDDSGIRVFGSLRQSSSSVLQVSVPVSLAERTPVSLQLSQDCFTDGEIVACRETGGSFVVDIRVAELRREPRFNLDDPVLITVLNRTGHPRIDGRVADMSRSGLSIVAGSPLPEGSPVRIEMSSAIVLGEVLHCRKTAGGFRAGLYIETVVFRQDEPAAKPDPPPIRPPGSLWGALKRLYHAVTS